MEFTKCWMLSTLYYCLRRETDEKINWVERNYWQTERIIWNNSVRFFYRSIFHARAVESFMTSPESNLLTFSSCYARRTCIASVLPHYCTPSAARRPSEIRASSSPHLPTMRPPTWGEAAEVLASDDMEWLDEQIEIAFCSSLGRLRASGTYLNGSQRWLL